MKKYLPIAIMITGILVLSGLGGAIVTDKDKLLDNYDNIGTDSSNFSTGNIQVSDEIINIESSGKDIYLEDKDDPLSSQYDVEFLPRVNVVNISDSVDTEYNFYASIPMTVFHHNNKVYQSLVISDHLNDTTTEYIIDDWKTYLDEWGGTQHINFIGGVSDYTKGEIMSEYGLGWDQISNITGDPITIANQIALHDWKYSDNIVIAPHIANPTEEDIESISNAAVIASLYNAPLLFTNPSSISTETLNVIDKINAVNAILVEIDDSLNSNINSQLQSVGVSIGDDITNESMVVSAIQTLTGHSTLCAIIKNQQGLPASLSGARYGGYVLFLPDTIPMIANILGDIIKYEKQSFYKLDSPINLPIGYRSGEEDLAEDFYIWLDGLGGDDPNNLETVITFNTQPYYDSVDGFSTTFDRAISGDPSDLTNPGAVPGRMPLHYIGNIALTNRDGMYRATIFSNPRPNHITLAMNAYEVQHTVNSDVDKWGGNHIVNEVFGYPYRGWCPNNSNFPWQDIQNNTPDLSPILPPGPGDGNDSDPGQFASFNELYETHSHSGAYAGTGSHPSQPGVSNIGFVDDINNGSVFLYFSCHGGGTSIAVRNTDNGVAQDSGSPVWGEPYWPDDDERVYDGSGGGSYSQNDLNSDLNNVHGAMTAYNACSMANGKMNEVLLEHGGAASYGSYTSVSFDGSGWWWNVFVHLITHEGYTIGEAATYATARIAELYTPGANNGPGNVDTSLQYVLYGDPNVLFVQSNWTSPEPLNINVDYGGHKPDKPPHSFLVTIDPTEIPIGVASTIDVNVKDEETNDPIVANVSIDGWGVNEEDQTNINGNVSFTITPPYGENLTLTVEKEDYDTYEGTIVVTGGTLFPGDITASVPSLGVEDVLAPSIEGMINGTSSVIGFTLSAMGCGINESVYTTTGSASLTATPTSVGTVNAAMIKNGYRVLQEKIPVLTLHLGISHQPSSLIVDQEWTVNVTVNCTESGTPIEGVTVNIQGCGIDETNTTNDSGIAGFIVFPNVNGYATITVQRPGFEIEESSILVEKADMSVETIGEIGVNQQLPISIYVNNSATGMPLDNANVAISGCGVNTNGITENGIVIIVIQPSTTGTIDVTTTRLGYNNGATSINVVAGITGDLNGTVTDFDTTDELEGVEIELYNSSVDPSENDPAFVEVTDVNGYYSISNMPIGEYNIHAWEFGYEPYYDTLEILESDTTTHDIDLIPALTYTVQGDITDSNTGELLWANITVYREDNMDEVTSLEVLDGSYSLNLIPYTYVFKVSAVMHQTVLETIQVSGDMSYDFSLIPGIFIDDIESGENLWTHSAASGPDLWHISERDSHSSSHSWYCGSEITGEYDDNMDDSLITPVFSLMNYDSVTLTFWHKYDFESLTGSSAWDGSDVEISVDGGAWGQIFPVGWYDDYIYGSNNGAFVEGTAVYAHSSNGWKEAEFDLTDYIDHNVQISFRFGSDGSVTEEGWYIDDVVIYGETISSTSPITDLSHTWNFISLPFNQSVDIADIIVKYNGSDYTWTEATDPINGPIVDPNIYGWDRTMHMYFQASDTLEPGYGYWIYAYFDCELCVENISATYDNYITDLKLTWNSIGVPCNQSVNIADLIIHYDGDDYTWTEATDPINGPIVDPNIYGWDRTMHMYFQASDTLEPGYAYWIYAYYDCSLNEVIL